MKLERIKQLPNLNPNAIERAVEAFIKDSRVHNVDEIGMFNQTIESIAQATIFATNNAQHFWLCHQNGEVWAYALAHISKDIDNQLTYTMSQAWVCPELRGKKIVKEWKEQFIAEAKKCLCKHIMIPASRNTKPYLRFLGHGFHEYATLLKTEI
jgi:hypothetical protein